MKLKDSFKLSLNNILHRKLRAWLTLLGIIIGVAAVVSIISIGEGAQSNLTENLSDFGADIITISPGFNRAGFFGGSGRGRDFGDHSTTTTQVTELGKRDLTIIKGNPNILLVNEIVAGRGEFIFLAETVSVSIQGVNPVTWTETNNVELDSGRFLGVSDSGTIVIGDRIANDNFKQQLTIGRKVTIESKPFTVIGILKEGSNDSTVFMPLITAWEITDVNRNVYTSIQAKVNDPEKIEEITGELEQQLRLSRKVTERNQDFTIRSSLAFQEQISEVLDTLTLFLGAIAAISLLVGAVGVANSMFTSVLEQTREIGIMKALGSTEREILELFVIESGLFGLIGGLIGVIIGTIVAFGISFFATTLVTPQLMIFAILLSTIIGIISGIIPARAASKLKPVEALRYE
ncbi:ABC transporter permease [archaeon]|nr:ABC transporter permease [archaeon]